MGDFGILTGFLANVFLAPSDAVAAVATTRDEPEEAEPTHEWRTADGAGPGDEPGAEGSSDGD